MTTDPLAQVSIHPCQSVEPFPTTEVVLNAIAHGILWIDRNGCLQGCNTAFQALIDQRYDLRGCHLLDLLPLQLKGNPLPPNQHPAYCALTHSESGSGIYQYQHNGAQLGLEISWFKRIDDEQGAVLVVADVTQRLITEQRALDAAFHDPLTGLASRNQLVDRMQHIIHRATAQPNYHSVVVLFNVDRFKVINDSLGHAQGDQLLKAIATRIQSCLNPTDTFARLGGDEFVIVLSGLMLEPDKHTIESLLQVLKVPFKLNEEEIFISASMGIVANLQDYLHPEDVLRDADNAMHRAKSKGRGRYEVFNPTMHTHTLSLLQLENDLRRAIANQEFYLNFQPVVSLRNQRVVGFEALVRWHHPTKGLVPPSEFIPVAEETGLILPLGWWVLRQACQQMRQWQTQFPQCKSMFMSVNISARQFSEPDLIERITEILHETGLETRSLKLEITESMLIDDVEAVIIMLNKLHHLGIQLSVDDFGTGYSSLGYLNRFPIDTLKIDRSFVNNVDADAEKMEIIKTVVTLAWNLGMDVIAEGVETQMQLHQLKALQCENGQGFFFSKPMSSEDATAFLSSSLSPPNQSEQ